MLEQADKFKVLWRNFEVILVGRLYFGSGIEVSVASSVVLFVH